MKNKILVCFFSICIFSISAYPQKKVSGIILDEKGGTPPGATVAAKGTMIVVKTDVNGKFTMDVPEKTITLVNTIIGLQPEEVAIGTSNDVSVVLTSSAALLSDVVVIGYGTVKRANVSSAISSVKAKDLKDLPLAGIDQAIQGRVSGVTIDNNVGQPGGGASIKLRGITTINANDSLKVIDAVPFLKIQGSVQDMQA